MIAVLNRAIAFRAGIFCFDTPCPVRGIGEAASERLVDALEVEVVITAADGSAAAITDLAPVVFDRADAAVESVEGVVGTGQYLWIAEHFRSNR